MKDDVFFLPARRKVPPEELSLVLDLEQGNSSSSSSSNSSSAPPVALQKADDAPRLLPASVVPNTLDWARIKPVRNVCHP